MVDDYGVVCVTHCFHCFTVYGGGYTFGDGWEFTLYDGTNLALNENVIVVARAYSCLPLALYVSLGSE
jgi:hypothetical protein